MNISPRYLYHFVLWIGWPVISLTLLVLASCITVWIFITVFPVMVLIFYIQRSIICPSCHKQIGWGFYNPVGIKILRIKGWRSFIPRYCDACGYDLSNKSELHRIFKCLLKKHINNYRRPLYDNVKDKLKNKTSRPRRMIVLKLSFWIIAAICSTFFLLTTSNEDIPLWILFALPLGLIGLAVFLWETPPRLKSRQKTKKKGNIESR